MTNQLKPCDAAESCHTWVSKQGSRENKYVPLLASPMIGRGGAHQEPCLQRAQNVENKQHIHHHARNFRIDMEKLNTPVKAVAGAHTWNCRILIGRHCVSTKQVVPNGKHWLQGKPHNSMQKFFVVHQMKDFDAWIVQLCNTLSRY